MNRTASRYSLRTSLFLGFASAAVLSANPAAAQAVAAVGGGPEVVIVTGTLLPEANTISESPVQTITSGDIQVKGATDVSDFLNDLPQTYVNNASDFSNTNNPLSSPGGVTTVDLRALGPTRTLVLVNGRRLGVGDPNTGNPEAAPDIDQIPVPLIDRVEILTGGASSTYGSDAVAGVVNFILKRDFQGLQVDAQYGGDWHDNNNSFARGVEQATITANTQGPLALAPRSVFDGQNENLSLTMGTNTADNKGNVTAYIVYRHATPVFMRDRDFSACQINITDSAVCAGSSNSNYFRPRFPNALGVYSIVGNQALPRPQPGSVPASSFNSNLYETLSRENTRFNGGFLSHYDVAPFAQAYAEFSFMDDRSFQQIAPDAVFRGQNAFAPDGSGNFLTNCNNPLLSAQEVNAFCTSEGLSGARNTELEIGRRNIEGGPRSSLYEHMNFRGVIGVQGDLTSAWHYNAYGSYYYVTVDQRNNNYLGNTKINNALQVGGTAANPVCLNGGGDGCVPYDIWTQGAVTPAQLAYLTEIGTSRGTLSEQILEADVTGDLGEYGIRSPFARDSVLVALGGTYRRDKLDFQADQAEQSNDLEGFGGAAVPISNSLGVTEEYGEVRAALAQDQPFIQDLSLDAGLRFSSYSTGSKATTWKVGAQWAPIPDIRFRGTYDVAIRAPSILELFTPQTVTNTSIVSVDPCAPVGATPATATLAQCERTGVTPAEYGNGGSTSNIGQCPAGQCAILLGGNPNLAPEKAKTFSVGFTATPTLEFLNGLTASVDYFKIEIPNEIAQGIPIDIALNQCLTTGNPQFCSLIVRTPIGQLYGSTVTGGGYIRSTDVNVASVSTSGIDFQAGYRRNLEDFGVGPYGSLSFYFVGTYTLTSKTQTLPTQPVYDCAGLFGNTCQSPLPVWRHLVRVSWLSPWDVTLSMQWRFIGGTGLDSNTSQAALTSGTFDALNARIPAFSYFDFNAIWDLDPHLELRAGITNAFDKDPPIISNLITGTGTPNTYNTYDLLGRTVYLALTSRF
ncbi:MAG: TonB-dependent receptor [Alphaproteobacteria bacterium]|nr:TonB-dependent receptor [Alphaproteobacteria bacterium]